MNCGLKEDFSRAQMPVGTVVVNGKVSKSMVSNAADNTTPYYPLAAGKFRNCLGIVRRGELVYHYHKPKQQSLSMCSVDPLKMLDSTCRIEALTSINGQGDATLSASDWMSTIQVDGIIDMTNDSSGTDLYNIITGGIHDVRNNGNDTITVGDYVMAYAPTLDEIPTGGGKNKTEAEKNGAVTLWYKPYRPELHRTQKKQIYECLRDINNAKPYLDSYRRQCSQLLDTIYGTGMVVFAQQFEEIAADFANGRSKTEILTNYLIRAGHSEFKKMALPSMPAAALAEKRDRTRDALFVPYSINDKNATVYILNENDANVAKVEKDSRRKLNHIQKDSTGLFIESSAYFVNQFRNRVVGQAKSTAPPGYNFSLELM